MRKENIPFEKTGKFNALFTDYLNQKEEVKPFYDLNHTPDSFAKRAESYSDVDRETLVNTLREQHSKVEISDQQNRNLELLRQPNTFTITTGHQLQLMSGPLFFIYKIITTIRLAKDLSEQYPAYNFVPIYWMASEDHDFAEVNHFHLFGEKYQWNSTQKGAVGYFTLDSLQALIAEFPEELKPFAEVYKESENLAEATLKLVQKLFGPYGLLTIDANCRAFKGLFKDVLAKELFESFSFDTVNKTSQKLDSLGYKTQVTPREINLFYLKDDIRERIVRDGDEWKVLNTDISWSRAELELLLENEPEVFSPNVVLRPVLQQRLLPNVSYVGGPGELIYWLQLKSTFECCNVDFPILTPRLFGLFLNQNTQKKLSKLPIDVLTLFKEDHEIKNDILEASSEQHFQLDDEKLEFEQTFARVIEKAGLIDPTLVGAMEGEKKKFEKQLENIEKRLKKGEERKLDQVINQATNLKSKIFPEGKLQERHDNIFSIIVNYPNFINDFMNICDPFDLQFNLLYE